MTTLPADELTALAAELQSIDPYLGPDLAMEVARRMLPYLLEYAAGWDAEAVQTTRPAVAA